ncbi:MAG TPA: hypothetical protein VFI17_01265 [Solirubrobacterales bacterium]|nr:hypothetical protein [Solirubrobacterales bacterium]
MATISEKVRSAIAARASFSWSTGRGDRGVGEAAGVGVVSVFHPQLGGGFVHLGDEGFDAAGLVDRQQRGDVVGRGQQQRLQRVPLAQHLAGFHRDDGLVEFQPPVQVCDVAGTDRDREAVLARFQRVVPQHQIGGHHLGDAGDRHRPGAAAGAEVAESLNRQRRLTFARPGDVE